jgi:ubiquinone/menaquinone biosynthesis C-methylase UbiE
MGAHHKVSPSIERRRMRVHAEVERAVRDTLSLTIPTRILDVGTGYGISVQLLTKQFRNRARIWSIDPSRSVIRDMRRSAKYSGAKWHVSFKQAEAEALPFPARKFDLVVSLLSLHHFSNAERGLREMVRVLAPRGKLIVADWRPAASPVVPHSAKDIPSPAFVLRVLKRLEVPTVVQRGRYWYLVEGAKQTASAIATVHSGPADQIQAC